MDKAKITAIYGDEQIPFPGMLYPSFASSRFKQSLMHNHIRLQEKSPQYAMDSRRLVCA